MSSGAALPAVALTASCVFDCVRSHLRACLGRAPTRGFPTCRSALPQRPAVPPCRAPLPQRPVVPLQPRRGSETPKIHEISRSLPHSKQSPSLSAGTQTSTRTRLHGAHAGKRAGLVTGRPSPTPGHHTVAERAAAERARGWHRHSEGPLARKDFMKPAEAAAPPADLPPPPPPPLVFLLAGPLVPARLALRWRVIGGTPRSNGDEARRPLDGCPSASPSAGRSRS